MVTDIVGSRLGHRQQLQRYYAAVKDKDNSYRDTRQQIRLVVLRLNVPVNNFSVISGRSHRFLGN